ncbi:MAG: hypothetical protein U5P41_10185 [Gammaproteobacteria bacterium]|nr:hypothetical protein [Gammaproteobacteria bacterium]
MSSMLAFVQDSLAGQRVISERGEHHLLLTWLVFTGTLLFALFVSWQENLLPQLYATDRSKISFAITLIYALVTAHCAFRISRLSYESNEVDRLSRYIHSNPQARLNH